MDGSRLHEQLLDRDFELRKELGTYPRAQSNVSCGLTPGMTPRAMKL